jgi:FkbM family methyltransferase
VAQVNDRLAQAFLRYAAPLGRLRHIPVVGRCFSWAAAVVVPRRSLTWVQVQHGPAAGTWLRLNPRTGHDALQGVTEPEVQVALLQHLRPGMTFYDIGANIGFLSLLAARLVGKHGRVIAFEADPEVASRFREHVECNEFSWATLEEKAVWSESRRILFARADPKASPDRGLGHVVDSVSADTIEIDALSLDDFVRTSGVAPDFIKCDVEGAEVEVFRGAQRLLAEKRPGILCEIHSEENRRVLLDEFVRLGYACTNCGDRHLLALPQ